MIIFLNMRKWNYQGTEKMENRRERFMGEVKDGLKEL